MMPSTLTIGTKTKQQILDELKENGHTISLWAKELVDKITFSMIPQTLELVELRVDELKIGKYPTTKLIQEKIETLGYSLVPQETALYLRLTYTDQPIGEWITCFSKPIAGADGYLNVLGVARDSGGSWVRWDYAFPDDQWDGGIRLLVCRKASLSLEPSAPFGILHLAFCTRCNQMTNHKNTNLMAICQKCMRAA